MKPLHEDQIHNAPFIEMCTHIWSDDVSRSQKSGVYGYYEAISKEFNKPLVDYSNFPKSGVIFVGMCHIIETIFQAIPTGGSYIFIHRTNDRQYLPEFDAVKPKSVKHVYTVDCMGTFANVTAIPFGNNSINGEDMVLKQIAEEYIQEKADTKVFARFNVNHDGSTAHRQQAIDYLPKNTFIKFLMNQIPSDEFYREVKKHKYTLALAGCGADASRQWSSIQLGSIPIVSDVPQMRHFEDLPMLYFPKKMEDFTEEWLSLQSVEGKSTDRMRASYWQKHITDKRNEYGI